MIALTAALVFALLSASVHAPVTASAAADRVPDQGLAGDSSLHAQPGLQYQAGSPSTPPPAAGRQLVQVYLMTKNEQVMLPHAVHHYRTRFPGCPITVYDHNSTDRTVELAHSLGCTVHPRQTNDGLQDNVELAKIKSEFAGVMQACGTANVAQINRSFIFPAEA